MKLEFIPMKKIYKSYTISEAKRKLEKYCAYQERCHQEVIVKLREMRMIPEAIDQITVHLIENDYLNEQRFALEYTRGKFHMKKWGKARLRNELTRRDISKYIIENALNQISRDKYLETFDALSEHKWQQLAGEENYTRRKRKLFDYLQYRGWEKDLIYDKINKFSQR